MVSVKRIVIHELVKRAGISNAETYISSDPLELSDNVIQLVERLNASYGKDSISYAKFDTDSERVFPDRYQIYVESRRTSRDFITFSRITINNLRDQIQNVPGAKGGFFVFVDYENNDIPFTGIFLVRDTNGLLFTRTRNQGFEVNTVKYMNTDKLAMACRINQTNYQGDSGKYLSLIKNRQTEISEYFLNWISIRQTETSTEFTNLLYELINGLTPPVNPATGQEFSIDDFRKNVVDYVRTQPYRTVNLQQMGLHFYQDENTITNYAEQNNIEIDHEFQADPRALKRFLKIEVTADGINLKFNRGEIDRKVRFSRENPNIILIESERFVQALRHEIEGE